MLNIFKKIALILTFLICANIKAQELPPIENFSPLNYSGGNQNWAISQSDENYIYIANNSGLLEFNGEKWNLYPSPNNTILRSVNVVKNRVYTGCYMEFGFWEKNEFGVLDYTSLSNTLKEDLIEDEQFWKILELDKWILFQSLNRIYIYNTLDKSFKIINSKTPITKAFNIEGIIYFQKINDGVYKVENGEVLPISTNEIFKNNIVVNIFKVKAKLLLQTQQKGFYFIDEDGETKWNIEFNKILEASSVYSSIKLEDDSFILGTISNGIYHIDSQGNLINQINQEVGLNNNTVLSIFQDKDQNIWLGLDNGISVVNFSSPFKVFNDVKGKLGSVYTSVIFNDYLYLGTNQGLFYKKLNSNTTFNFIKGTNGQVWSLAIYDNTLFCGHDIGTYIIKNNQAKLISDVQGTWDIKPIPTQENLLIQGNYNGLNILEKVNDSWRFKNKITGFDISSKFFEFSETHQLFVSHEYKGVFKLEIDKKFEKVVEVNEETSVTKGLKSGLVSYDNNLYYSSEKGVFKYSKDKHFFELDSLFTNQFFKNDSYYSGKLITNSQTNTLWGFLDKSIVYFSPGILNNTLKINRIPLPESKRRDIAGYESLTHLKDQSYLIGTARGYIILNLDKLIDKDYEVKITSITKASINLNESKVKLLNDNHSFKFKNNNLSFNFSVPEYEKFTEINYQYKLVGLYNDWSKWSTNSEATFKNLPYGNYTFKVNARVGNKLSKNTANYSFTIERPWFISNLMLVFYSLLFILMVFLIHNFYKRYYTKQKSKLIEKKQQEFTLSQLENDKVIMKLRNEKLRNEVEGKTRELSASAMNIIKKNELLSTIKNELSKKDSTDNVKRVLKIINQNLNNNDDWEAFQEAFNNADSDFLKKAKSLHPTLTPNDLRLCAYLRLNLSSKEIAPLLNISVRSVEIKRYRLRKKINLEHEKSLVEYILEL